jgi:hypothetical protein
VFVRSQEMALLRPLQEICGNLLKSHRDDWEVRYTALQAIQALVKDAEPQQFDAEVLRCLKIPLTSTAKDLRSNLVREASLTIKVIAEIAGTGLRPIAHELLNTLIEVRGSGNKVRVALLRFERCVLTGCVW